MEIQSALDLSVPISLGLAAFGSAIGLGLAVMAAMNAIGRQPEAAKSILVNMTIGCAFIEAITIYVLVFAFMFVK